MLEKQLLVMKTNHDVVFHKKKKKNLLSLPTPWFCLTPWLLREGDFNGDPDANWPPALAIVTGWRKSSSPRFRDLPGEVVFLEPAVLADLSVRGISQ